MSKEPRTYRPRTASYALRLAQREAPRPWLSWSLCALLVVLFLRSGMLGSEDPDRLLQAGGLYGPATWDEPWRLVSVGFLHLGLLHLGFNLMVLLDLGPSLERSVGTLRFALIYAVSLVTASLASSLWAPLGLSVGASGAILGLAGALYVLGSGLTLDEASLKELREGLTNWLLLLLLLGLFLPVDNAGHLGGLAGGLAAGWLLRPAAMPLWQRALGSAVLVALCLGTWQAFRARVSADPVASARVHYLQGLHQLDAKQAGRAAESFEQAWVASPELPFAGLRAFARRTAGLEPDQLPGLQPPRPMGWGRQAPRHPPLGWLPYYQAWESRRDSLELERLLDPRRWEDPPPR